MDDMPTHKRTQRHAAAEAAPKRDHIWVLAVIAGFALFDVWESWTQVGNKSGFAHGTGWTLTVIVEAYACYALYAWFNAPGPRSRRFAMWSAAGVLVLSLIGQGASSLAAHRLPPLWLAVFVKDLPVVVLALIAMLVHLRQKDREAITEAVRQDAKDAEIVSLRAALEVAQEAPRAELEALRDTLETAQAERDEARTAAARAAAKADQFARKLAAVSGAKRTAKPAANKSASSPANKTPGSLPETEVPNDVDAQAEALLILAAEPDIKGSDLGLRLGKTKRYGQILKNKLTPSVPGGDG